MNFTIALAQIDTTLGDLEKNIRKHVDWIARARDGGADLVVFPELSLSGYTVRDLAWDAALRATDQRTIKTLLGASDAISIVVGAVEESPEYGIHNSAFYLEKGKPVHVHRKTYPPGYGMFEETRYFSPGKSVRAFDSALGRFGMLICEDLWHPALPYVLAQDRAQLIIGLAASPTRLGGEQPRPPAAVPTGSAAPQPAAQQVQQRQDAPRAHPGDSIENLRVNSEHHRSFARLLSTYLVFCNRVGYEDGVNFWGGSEIIAPSGDVLVRAKLFEEDLVFAEIDGNEVRRARRFSRHFVDEDPHLVLRELERIDRSGR